MPAFATTLFALLLGVTLTAQQLDHRQRQAVERQERNLIEAKQRQAKLDASWAESLPVIQGDAVVPPAALEPLGKAIDEAMSKAEAMLADLQQNHCPAGHERVRAITTFVDEVRTTQCDRRRQLAPKLEAMRRLADPKSWPDLDVDFRQIDELAAAYRERPFQVRPERAEELLQELPAAEQWARARFQHYRPLLQVTGGKSGKLYGRYERLAEAIKGFRSDAGRFFADVRTKLPERLQQVRESATRAVAAQQPEALTNGVQRQFDEIDRLLRVCRAIAPEHEDSQRMTQDVATAKAEVAAATTALRERVIAAARPPVDAYTGADAEALRAKVRAAWQQAWPADEIVAVRLPMASFDRRERLSWDAGAKAWIREDRSELCVIVIVKTDDRLATSFPAYVTVDHVSGRTTIGVHTKHAGYVSQLMLLAKVSGP